MLHFSPQSGSCPLRLCTSLLPPRPSACHGSSGCRARPGAERLAELSPGSAGRPSSTGRPCTTGPGAQCRTPCGTSWPPHGLSCHNEKTNVESQPWTAPSRKLGKQAEAGRGASQRPNGSEAQGTEASPSSMSSTQAPLWGPILLTTVG